MIQTHAQPTNQVDVQNFNEKSSHTVIVSKELLDETRALAGREDFSVEDYFKVRLNQIDWAFGRFDRSTVA